MTLKTGTPLAITPQLPAKLLPTRPAKPLRVLVLFADEWDASFAQAEESGHFQFFFEGFDLFKFPSNAQLFTFNIHRFARTLAARYKNHALDAIYTSDEQFGPVAASMVGAALGLPHLPLAAVMLAQHKFLGRQRHQAVAPEATPQFAQLSPAQIFAGDIALAFPLYIKPVKAAFSELARRVNTLAELQKHLRFAWFEAAIIHRLVKPFHDATRELQLQRFGRVVDAHTMIAESVMTGHQVTINGYAEQGVVKLLGTVDSIMYPGTDQFMRFQYPSRIPDAVQARMSELTTRIMKGIGFTHGMFNLELLWNEAADTLHVIEVNPRVAGQFFDLFQHVDGYSLFEATLALAANRPPTLRHREGAFAHAASFVLRDFSGMGLAYWPSAAELAHIKALHPRAHIHFYPKRGADLKRELKWLGNYRYSVMNIAGVSLEDMFAQFILVRDTIQFHPKAVAARFSIESIEALLAEYLSFGGAHAA